MVSTVVFITRHDTLLLVRQNNGKQYWSLPVGVIENGESVEEAVRKVKEETSLDIRIERVIAIYSKSDEGSIANFTGRICDRW